MADFCKQCSIDMFGEDFGDLADLQDETDTAKGIYTVALCEGCGPIQVDHDGKCMNHDQPPGEFACLKPSVKL